MSLLAFCEWLAATEGSTALRESLFMYPLVESTHVLFLLLFVGLTVVWDLRLLGLAFTGVPVSEMNDRDAAVGARRLRRDGDHRHPAVLRHSRPHLPERVVPRQDDLPDPRDDQHLVLPLRASSPRPATWDTDARLPSTARRAGLASLVLWACIIVFGRFIAYNWFDCDIQPQSAFVNWFAGCVVPPAQ